MIIRHSKFASNPFGNGGSKRSTQIEELLESGSLTFENNDFKLPKGLAKFQLFKLSFRAIRFIKKNIGWKSYPSLKSKIGAIKYFALRIPVILDKYKGKNTCFVWESTVSENYGYPYLMKAAGAKVIAVPHNLESVVPTQKDAQTRKIAPQWLYEEIERLKKCDAVFAISQVETWLLRLFGVNAHYLPYYPPKEAIKMLSDIRDRRSSRKKNPKNKFLLLGTASNPPTRKGMQSIIDAVGDKEHPFEILVAGYGTESLRIGNNNSIRFLGAISPEQLSEVLYETDAILVNQAPTSGALTKISEMLIAGVPVFVNYDSARDYYEVEDVLLYSSFDDLFDKLAHFKPHQAAMPIRKTEYEEFFIQTVKELSETHDK